jgi:hypothetical protein
MSNINEPILFDNLRNIIDNNNNINRTDDDRCDRVSCANIHNETQKNASMEDTVSINVNIYRYKFEDTFTKELYQFSKIHQYDHRKDFKIAWNTWVEENDELVSNETQRLDNLGYDGDILDKMFKSARYYFRKKSTEKKEPKTRREYISVQKELLDAMDAHIKRNLNNDNYKPSDGFLEFCKDNIDILKEEVSILCKNGITNSNEVKDKIKKTYKNRYFMIISK